MPYLCDFEAERRAQLNRSRSRTNMAFNSGDVLQEIDISGAGEPPNIEATSPSPAPSATVGASKPTSQQRRKRDNGANDLMAQLEAALTK